MGYKLCQSGWTEHDQLADELRGHVRAGGPKQHLSEHRPHGREWRRGDEPGPEPGRVLSLQWWASEGRPRDVLEAGAGTPCHRATGCLLCGRLVHALSGLLLGTQLLYPGRVLRRWESGLRLPLQSEHQHSQLEGQHQGWCGHRRGAGNERGAAVHHARELRRQLHRNKRTKLLCPLHGQRGSGLGDHLQLGIFAGPDGRAYHRGRCRLGSWECRRHGKWQSGLGDGSQSHHALRGIRRQLGDADRPGRAQIQHQFLHLRLSVAEGL